MGRPDGALYTLLDAQGLYLTGEDNLRVTSIGSIAGAVLAIEGRLVSPDGVVIPIAERHVPNSNSTAAQTVAVVAEGVLTNLQVRIQTGTVPRGGVFVLVEIIRGASLNSQAIGTLLQGYATTNARLAWPGSPLAASTDGVGRLRSITGTDPAAGAEISETVPAGVRWLLHAFSAALVTSVVVANRVPRLVVDDGANVLAQIDSAVLTPASSNHRHSWTRGAGAGINLSTGSPTTAAPTFPLSAGFRLRTSTLNLDAGDNWGAPQYLVEEFIE